MLDKSSILCLLGKRGIDLIRNYELGIADGYPPHQSIARIYRAEGPHPQLAERRTSLCASSAQHHYPAGITSLAKGELHGVAAEPLFLSATHAERAIREAKASHSRRSRSTREVQFTKKEGLRFRWCKLGREATEDRSFSER